jgi:hypothetical protein
MAGDQPFLQVLLNKSPITTSVASVEIEDHDRLIDKATIVLRDPHVSAPNLARNDEIEVTLGWESEHAVLFSGRVVADPQQAPATGVPIVTIVAYDPSYSMHEQKHDENLTGSLSGIVYTIASRYPLVNADKKNIICDPDPQFTGDPPLRQHNLTDLQFLQWLAWRYGHRAFAEYNDDAARFYFVSNHRLLQSDPLGALQWCHGMRQLKEFKYERVASRAARQRIASVPDPRTGEVTPTVGATPPPIDQPEPDPVHADTLGKLDPAERARYESGGTGAPPPAPEPAPMVGLPSDPRLADAVTIWDPTQVLGLRGNGTAVGTIHLRAKGKVTIDGLAPWAQGDWYVNKAVHSWKDTTVGKDTSATYETKFTVTR